MYPIRPVAGWVFPAALSSLFLILVLAILRLGPPTPKPLDAPSREFSAARARAILEDLAGNSAQHPLGSAANARVGERIRERFRRFGYPVRDERDFVCVEGGICASVGNIVAELPGREPGVAVLLTAHYDSVGAGPGVSDDLAGVAAALECARILKMDSPPRHSILFLMNEGEEAGLLGAQAFLESSPQAGRVKAVVNLEARGTSGPSLMFETGPVNGWLMPLFDGSVPHPRTNSLFSTLYEYLPNDTDFSVFKLRGISGFNFAYLGNPAHYHTPLDNLANASPASLQHHGENALATVRALAATDLSSPPRGRAVFFDVLGLEVFWWPASRGPFLATVPLLLILVTAVRLRRRGSATGGSIGLGLLAWVGLFALSTAAGFTLTRLIELAGGLKVSWPAHGLPGQAAFWLLPLVLTVAMAGWVRRAGFFGLWIGIWLAWSLLGLVTAILLPGASYLFVVPAWAAGLAGLALPGGERARALAAILPAVVPAALWFPVLPLVYDGMGSGVLWIIAALVAAVLTPLLPPAAAVERGWRRALVLGGTGVVLLLALLVTLVPAFTPDSPRRINIVFSQDAATGEARYIVPATLPMPEPMRRAAHFGEPAPPDPWSPPTMRSFIAPAPSQGLPGPSLTVLRDEALGGKRRLRLRLASPRGATAGFVIIPREAELTSATVGGKRVPLDQPGRAELRSLGILTLPPEGVEFEVVLGSTAPQAWYVFDSSPGLPATAAALARSRPPWASPANGGDVTEVRRKIVL